MNPIATHASDDYSEWPNGEASLGKEHNALRAGVIVTASGKSLHRNSTSQQCGKQKNTYLGDCTTTITNNLTSSNIMMCWMTISPITGNIVWFSVCKMPTQLQFPPVPLNQYKLAKWSKNATPEQNIISIRKETNTIRELTKTLDMYANIAAFHYKGTYHLHHNLVKQLEMEITSTMKWM